MPAVRGPEVSRPFDQLVSEVAQLASEGISEVTLLGQNVNSYGRDLAINARRAGEDVRLRPMFAELLRTIGDIDGIQRIRYTSPHPKDMQLDVAQAMAETAAVCEHLHMPLQSGSDRVLSLMHRGYNAERYLRVIEEARATIPDLAVTTDIIVGFPGETEADFERTLEVAAEVEYDSAYTFVFSPRPGTEAADMEGDFCDPAEVTNRYERLRGSYGTFGPPTPCSSYRPDRRGCGRGDQQTRRHRADRTHPPEQAHPFPCGRTNQGRQLRKCEGHRSGNAIPEGRAGRSHRHAQTANSHSCRRGLTGPVGHHS